MDGKAVLLDKQIVESNPKGIAINGSSCFDDGNVDGVGTDFPAFPEFFAAVLLVGVENYAVLQLVEIAGDILK